MQKIELNVRSVKEMGCARQSRGCALGGVDSLKGSWVVGEQPHWLLRLKLG
jgi:hypothetical protein